MIFFAKIHPLIVHFPMGLLISGAVFEIYGALRNEEVVETAGRFNIRLGFWCLFPVLLVGFLGMIGLENTEKFRDFLATHLKFAFITAGDPDAHGGWINRVTGTDTAMQEIDGHAGI